MVEAAAYKHMKQQVNSRSRGKLGGDALCSAACGHHPMHDARCLAIEILRRQEDRAHHTNSTDKTKDLLEKGAKFGCI